MSDLISRKALTKTFEEQKQKSSKLHELIFFDAVMEIIDNQPTAYDVEKVVEKIEGLRHPYTSFEDGTGCLHEYDFYIESAKDIVKGGGIDE